MIDSKKWPRWLLMFWVYTLIVILWGAWVRISHSGNGCGDHWPLCDGAFIPSGGNHKTWIEYAHRLMSGSYGLIVLFIYFKLRKLNNSPHFKRSVQALVILMITEALIGAVLVKGQLVTQNDSMARLIVMSFHQLNSFLLTGVTYLIYLMFKTNNYDPISNKNYKVIFIFLLIPITGAIASLSTTLFPSISLWQGILEDFTIGHHLFIRLRVLHPLFAIFIAFGLIYALYLKNQTRLAVEFLLAVTIGLVTLLTLSPIYLKLTHLLIAHLLWARLLQMLVSLPDSSKR